MRDGSENHVGGAPPYRPVLVAEAYLFVLERPSVRWFTRLSRAFPSAFRADGYSPAPAFSHAFSLAQTMPVVNMAKPKR